MANVTTSTDRRLRVLVADAQTPGRRALCAGVSGISGLVLASTVSSVDLARRKIELDEIDVLLVEPRLDDNAGFRLVRDVTRAHPKLACFFIVSQGQRAMAATDVILAGALGVVERPEPRVSPEQARDVVFASLGQLVRASLAPAPSPVARERTHAARALPPLIGRRELIAIGVSTGGPPALSTVLRALSPSLRTPLVIVQHMGIDHVPHLVSLLASQTGRNVVLSSHGLKIEPSHTYIARGGVHLLVERRATGLHLVESDAPPEHNCRPAVDPMFRSVAQICGGGAVGVVMTGMGSDGALGARAMRDAGAPIVVQDEATSVVWGMPGAAVGLGAADVVAPVERIAKEIESWIAE